MFDDIIRANALRFNVPESWIRAVIQIESGWNPNAYRYEPGINDASYGLMQVLYGTATSLGFTGNPNGLYDPATNIEYGTRYIAHWISRVGRDVKKVISGYNSGSADNYKTNAQVARHVDKFLNALEIVVVPAAGIGILLLIGLFLVKKGR